MTTEPAAHEPAADESARREGPARWTGRVGLAGALAPAGFFAVMLVLGLLTPGYDQLARYGSELSLGPLG